MPANFVIKPFLEEHRAEMRSGDYKNAGELCDQALPGGTQSGNEKTPVQNPGFLSWMAAAEGKRPDLTMAGRAFMIIDRVGIMRVNTENIVNKTFRNL